MWAAWLGILAILFAQAAVAVYACPGIASDPASAQGPRMPCGDMDPASPNLCERHCHGADQQPGAAAVALPVFVAAFAIEPSAQPSLRAALRARPAPPPAPSPPLAVRHRFRI